MSFLIYPFKKAEKSLWLDFNAPSRKNVAERLLPNINKVAEYKGDFIELAEIYGIESVQLSLLLHPTANEFTLNRPDALTCWKIMNRLWNILHIKTSGVGDSCNKSFNKFHTKAENAKLKNKAHTYLAAINDIIKTGSFSEKNHAQFIELLKPCVPQLVAEYLRTL